MPFTPSHIAAVLPLRRWGVGLPLAALAAGSVSPDAPYFIPGLMAVGKWSHHPLAAISVDVAIGILLWAGWRAGAGALHDLSPAPIRQRWQPASWRSAPPWAVLLSVVVGAATHLIWDSFTHPHRFAATHLAVLSASYPSPLGGSWPGYQWAQYLSGAVGLIIVAWVGWRQPRRPTPVVATCVRTWMVVAATALASGGGAGLRIYTSTAWSAGVGSVVFAGITGAIAAAAITIAAFAAWQGLSTTRWAASTTSP